MIVDATEDVAVIVDKKKKLIIRILVVFLITIIIFGIFIYKKASSNETESISTTDSTIVNFPLKVSSVNIEELKTNNLPIIIDFGSDSCSPCKVMAPVLEKLNKEWQDKVIVQFVDVWKYTTAANNFPVSVIPTQIFYNADGTPYVPSESIQESIEFTLYSDKNTGEHIFTVHQGGLTETQMRKIFKEMGIE